MSRLQRVMPCRKENETIYENISIFFFFHIIFPAKRSIID
ncbi:hypothetical protein SSIL_1891 [Solibacillus silvestris StLB046]|uniref:Uncharacterized protein n=1 Tax=Solibacillus silvestris (strain StLB046) TaxID=1002809 RepID=F2F0S0_SOLSS|nr:hypothetical protein SSIL_1891 [Solibacillus silvestris StLB046]